MLKCDSSNMKDVYYSPADYEADLFDFMTDNIKEDRTSEDLLFQVMLDLGVALSSKIEETVIADKKVFNVADGFLIGKRLKYSRLAVWYHFSDFDEPHSSLK